MTEEPKQDPFSIARHLVERDPGRLIAYREGGFADGTRYTRHTFKLKDTSAASISTEQAPTAPVPLVLRVSDAIRQVPLSIAPARYSGGYKLRNAEEVAQAALDACHMAEVFAMLNNIAAWNEGDVVSEGFDEPCAARTARALLAKLEGQP